ncbi:MAG: DUF2807 domain-containing protein [Bacteroidaceae bacterium]|nr:DUF2807 domain-containing protein [Bacteroidaceae bacterium]MCF0185008.1 DUF2807 domain-containing protein [Bacteroidaceae bacterium]
MKRLQHVLIGLMSLIACGVACACSYGEQVPTEETVTQTYDITDFTGIQASGALKIKFEQADTFYVEATSVRSLLDALKVENQAGVLRLGVSKNMSRWKKNEVTIKGPELRQLDLSGACTFTTGDVTLDTDAHINLSGATKLELGKVQCNMLVMEQSGASKIRGDFILNGEAHVMNSGASTYAGSWDATGMVRIQNSGASSFKVDVKSPRIVVRNSGVSKCTMKVDCEMLELDNAGASHITISGRAKETVTRSSGLSKETFKDFEKK